MCLFKSRGRATYLLGFATPGWNLASILPWWLFECLPVGCRWLFKCWRVGFPISGVCMVRDVASSPSLPENSKNHLLFWLWRGLLSPSGAVCIIDCENSPCNKWREGTEQIFGIFGPNFQFGVCRSDIYLIFSPEVHFQLGCAGRSRRLNLGSQSRLWEIQRKREPHNISNEEYLDIIGQYRYLTKYMCPNLTLRQINISSSQLRGLIYMVHSPISLMGWFHCCPYYKSSKKMLKQDQVNCENAHWGIFTPEKFTPEK